MQLYAFQSRRQKKKQKIIYGTGAQKISGRFGLSFPFRLHSDVFRSDAVVKRAKLIPCVSFSSTAPQTMREKNNQSRGGTICLPWLFFVYSCVRPERFAHSLLVAFASARVHSLYFPPTDLPSNPILALCLPDSTIAYPSFNITEHCSHRD